MKADLKGMRDRRAWLVVAFIVPVLIVFAAYTLVTNTSPHEKYSALTMRTALFRESEFFSSIEKDVGDSASIKAALSGDDHIAKISAVRLFLTEHMSVVFLMGMLIGSAGAADIFRIFFFLRFGLAGASFFLFLRKNIGLKNDPSLLLSTVYAVSSITVFYVALNTSLMNGLIIMPLLLSAIDELNRRGTFKAGIIAILMFALTAASGYGGFMSCVPFSVVTGFFMLLSDRRKHAKDIISSVIKLIFTAVAGIATAAIAVIPMSVGFGAAENFKKLFTDGGIRFLMIDLIYKMLDCNISGASVSDSAPVMGIFVVTVFLVILFFSNRSIPVRAKTFSGIAMLLLYISVSYSSVDVLISGIRNSGVITYSRLVCLMCLMLILAAISLKNINGISKGSVYLTAFLIIGLIMIESSSASQVSPNTVSRLFSSLAVIFWCAVFVHVTSVKRELPSAAVTAALFGIFFNVFFCLGPADFAVKDLVNSHAQQGLQDASSLEIRLHEGEDFPVFSDDEQTYILLSSYVKDAIQGADAAQIINIVSRAAALDNVFEEISSEGVYFKDITDVGAGKYRIETPGNRGEVTIHSTLPNEYSRYFVVSMFQGVQFVSEAYSEHDVNSSFDGPFLLEMTPSDPEAYVRLTVEASDPVTAEYKIYMLRESGLSDLKNAVGYIRDGNIDLSDNSLLSLPGVKTVVTSISYNDAYQIRYEQDGRIKEADKFSLCGKLAFTFENNGNENLIMKIDYSEKDITVGIIITLIFLVCIIISTLMYNKTTRDIKEKNLA